MKSLLKSLVEHHRPSIEVSGGMVESRLGLGSGSLLLLLIAAGSVSSRSVVDIPQINNVSSSVLHFRDMMISERLINGGNPKGMGFKEDIETLISKYPEVAMAIVDKKPLNEFLDDIPPAWILFLPEEPLIQFWIENSPKTLAQYLISLPDSDSIALKVAFILSNQDESSQRDFLKELSQAGGDLSNSVWSRLSEDVSLSWWSDKNASMIVRDLTKLSPDAIKLLPFDVVSRSQNVDGLDVFSDDSDWNTTPRAHVCIWKNVIEKTLLILRRIYTAMRPASTSSPSGGFVPLLRCFGPRDLSNWISESNRVSNDKTPILEMIKNTPELGLNQLQVEVLADCIDWSDPSLDARRNVFHMLDASFIGQRDMKDYSEDHFRRFKVSWDLVLRVAKYRLTDISSTTLSNDLLREMGPLYVTRARDSFQSEAGPLELDVVNGAFSPWMRISQARTILKLMDDARAIQSDLVFALPSTNILEWTDSRLKRIFNIEKMTPTQKWAMAQNILSNKDFAPYYIDILEWIHPRSNLTFLEDVINIPEALALTIYKKDWNSLSSPMSKEDLNDKLKRIIPGLTCAQLQNSSLLDSPLLASFYSNYIKSKPTKDLSVFSTSLRLCFKNQMTKYLKEKAGLHGLSDMWTALTLSEVKSFGGYVLSSLKLEEICKVKNASVRDGIFQELGSLSVPELMSMMSYSDVKKIAALAIKDQVPSFSAINNLGSLTYFMDKSFLLSLHPFDIHLFLKNTLSGDFKNKLTCMKEDDRDAWSEILNHGFASPRSWTAWNLIHFGDLLINLHPEKLLSINPHYFRRALPQILEQSRLHHSFSNFIGFDQPTSFLKACEHWLDEDESDSKSFRTALNDLMRFYLRISEYSVRVVKRDSVRQLPPKDLRSRKALKEKLFGIYERLKHFWFSTNSAKDKNWDYMRNLVIQITKEKDSRIKGIVQREKLESMNATELYKEFRSSDTKISEHLDSIEDFLIDIQRLIIREYKYLFNLTATQITPEYKEDKFCSIVDCVDPDWCSIQDCFQLKYEDKPIQTSCDGLIAAGQSAGSLDPKDLSLWNDTEILDCLSVLGTISWESSEKKTDIWNAIETAVDLKNTEHLLSLGNLLEVIDLDDVEFSDKNIDAISLIGSYPRKNLDIITVGRIQKYLNSASNAKEILELRKIGLGHLLCSLNSGGEDSKLIEMLFGPLYGLDQSPEPTGDENEERIFDFNRLTVLRKIYTCDNELFRKEVANQILRYYDSSLNDMSPSDVSSLGLFMSGIEPKMLEKISKDNFELMHPSGVKYLTPDQVAIISVKKLSRMTPEALSEFKESHVPPSFPINSKQINLLRHNEHLTDAELKTESKIASVISGGSSSTISSYILRYFMLNSSSTFLLITIYALF